MEQLSLWVERLSSLHRSLLRRFAADEGLQLVHVEVLRFLHSCNRYSNTTQALSEYLGQTKGSISQSITHLEAAGFIKREQDQGDKRIFHLVLTRKGSSIAEKLEGFLQLSLPNAKGAEAALKTVLQAIQRKNGLEGFGVCANCKFNQSLDNGRFRCGLTEEILSKAETGKLCREFRDKESA